MFGPQTTPDVTTVDPAELWLPRTDASVPADWSEMIPTADGEDYTGENRPTFRYWEAVDVDDNDSQGELWAIVDCGDASAVHVGDDTDDIEDEDEREAEEARRDKVSERVDQFNSQGAGLYAEGPMMSYWYPVTDDTDEDQAREWAYLIRDLPLCVVEIDGRMGLALTGGGMDLSWEIAEAFLRIGYFPPADVVDDLPKMAGRGDSALDVAIVRAVHAGHVQRAERAQLRASRMAEAWSAVALEVNLPPSPRDF